MPALVEHFILIFGILFPLSVVCGWLLPRLARNLPHTRAIGLLAATVAGLTVTFYAASTFALVDNADFNPESKKLTTLIVIGLPLLAVMGTFVGIYRVFFPFAFERHFKELSFFAAVLLVFSLLMRKGFADQEETSWFPLLAPLLYWISAVFTTRFFARELLDRTKSERIQKAAVMLFAAPAGLFLVSLVLKTG